ncbi:MAG: TetR/AcrR family transcriptional regulator [Rhodospirillaceae bacterium]|nr:TetR/AcrR family transcriptional regulator [Rhodospirillaceae bacterium]
MPRPADLSLPSRIVAAAYALWSEGGEAAVTIRDVARRASTTTPSVYAHFEDRAAILRGVRALARGHFDAAMRKATGVVDGCVRLLDFVEAYPRDYELLYGYGYRERVTRNVQEAEFTMFEGYIRLACVRECDVRPTALAIASLLHGAAMFRLSRKARDSWWRECRKATLDACAALLEVRRSRDASGRNRRHA